jgi:2-amino-4-hydroxy-6-hydroxymethyldihydropteridine diphosphokinase
MAGLARTELLAVSSLYSSIDSSGPDYLNAVALLRTGSSRWICCMRCRRSSCRPGASAPTAMRRARWIWISSYGATSPMPELTVPHPRMWQRAFVLLPLAEIAPGCVSAEQLQAVADQGIERSLAQGWWIEQSA